MRLTVFNGSPRGKRGNTEILLAQFIQGFESVPGAGNSHELFHLNRVKAHHAYAQAFAEAEAVLLGFPLYTDAMPGIVKAFIEELAPYCGRAGNPPLGFLVQSGFPEAAHSRPVEVYLEKLARRLACPYLGTIVKGGCEGVRMMPDRMNRKLFAALNEIGREFGASGRFDPALLQKLARPERYPRWAIPLMSLLLKAGLGNIYWDQQLKENGAYGQRFARPYSG